MAVLIRHRGKDTYRPENKEAETLSESPTNLERNLSHKKVEEAWNDFSWRPSEFGPAETLISGFI